jgi:DNA-binding LytR/AlgR family response regulator
MLFEGDKMKYKLIIDNEKEESIVITAHERNDLIVEIEKLIKNNKLNLIGYQEDKMIPLVVDDIYSFYTKNGKIYAITKNENY